MDWSRLEMDQRRLEIDRSRLRMDGEGYKWTEEAANIS